MSRRLRHRHLAASVLIAAATVTSGSALPAQASGIEVRSIGGARPEAAALLAHGGSGGPLRTQIVALPAGHGRVAVPVLVGIELDGESLLAGQPSARLGIELTLYAVGLGGTIGAALAEGIAVDLGRHGGAIEAGGLRWLGSLELAPGDWSIRALVRNRQTGAFGLRETRLVLTTPGAEAQATFLAPVVAAADDWIEARSPALAPVAAGVLAEIGGPPSALPVLALDAPARLWAWIGGGEAGPLAARLVDGLGRPAGEPTLTARAGRQLAPGLAATELEMAAPGGRAGLRDLILTTHDGELVSLPHRCLARPADEAVAWNAVARVALARAAAEESPEAPAPVAPPASKEDLERFRAAYREAWRRYAAGDPEGGVAALQVFESAALEGDPKRAMGWLAQADRSLLSDIARSRPGALLPLALFYQELFRAHLAAGRIGLARRAEMVTQSLLVDGASRAATDEEREIVASALESLAADLLDAQAPNRAAALLERSTSLAPNRAGSWVALGALHERNRELDPARRALDRALAAAPRHREARLRRALIEVRTGSARRGVELLDQLIAEPALDWIAVIANQERARQHLATGDLTAAAALLENAARRFPAEPSLETALAYTLDRAGRRAEARAAVERATRAGRSFDIAPRQHYARFPVQALAAGRATVEERGFLARSELLAALGGGGGPA